MVSNTRILSPVHSHFKQYFHSIKGHEYTAPGLFHLGKSVTNWAIPLEVQNKPWQFYKYTNRNKLIASIFERTQLFIMDDSSLQWKSGNT